MPFKDYEKYKEWNRNRMRKKRAADKAKENMTIQKKVHLVITLDRPFTDEEKKILEEIIGKFEIVTTDDVKVCDESETTTGNSLALYNHTDTKMMMQRGGGNKNE